MGRKGKDNHGSEQNEKSISHDNQNYKTGKHSKKTSEESSLQENSEYQAKFGKRKIMSNWEKYEESQYPTDTHKGLDFALYNDKTHSTTQEHFRFSDEKEWESQSKTSDYFKLDLKELSNEILSVPLHERLQIDTSMFSEDQIQRFIKDAKMFEPEYVTKSKAIETRVLSVLKPAKEQKKTDDSVEWPDMEEELINNRNSTWDNKADNFFSLAEIDNELDNILSMPLPSHQANAATPQESQEEQQPIGMVSSTLDLQNDWLDSLLED